MKAKLCHLTINVWSQMKVTSKALYWLLYGTFIHIYSIFKIGLIVFTYFHLFNSE